MNTDMTYADFERLLAVYGSDRARWPIEGRTRAARLVARSGEARRLLAETEALDRALDRAPGPSLAGEAALAARIVAAAQRMPRVVAMQSASPQAEVAAATQAEVVQPPQSRVLKVAFDRAQHTPAPDARCVRFGSSIGVGALVTAASLALGILIGLSGLSQTVLRPVQQLTGLPVAGTQTSVSAQVDTLDEDLL